MKENNVMLESVAKMLRKQIAEQEARDTKVEEMSNLEIVKKLIKEDKLNLTREDIEVIKVIGEYLKKPETQKKLEAIVEWEENKNGKINN